VARATQRKGRAEGKTVYTCHACKEQLPTWAAAERHRDAESHYTFEVLQ
jgi:hypothetical protein